MLGGEGGLAGRNTLAFIDPKLDREDTLKSTAEPRDHSRQGDPRRNNLAFRPIGSLGSEAQVPRYFMQHRQIAKRTVDSADTPVIRPCCHELLFLMKG